MILKDKKSYSAVGFFKFSRLNEKNADKIRAFLDSKYFIDKI